MVTESDCERAKVKYSFDMIREAISRNGLSWHQERLAFRMRKYAKNNGWLEEDCLPEHRLEDTLSGAKIPINLSDLQESLEYIRNRPPLIAKSLDPLTAESSEF